MNRITGQGAEEGPWGWRGAWNFCLGGLNSRWCEAYWPLRVPLSKLEATSRYLLCPSKLPALFSCRCRTGTNTSLE